jgi:hypothetical protein
MYTYVHLRHRNSFGGRVAIELYAKEDTCIHMYIWVTAALFGEITIEFYAEEGKCIHMYICITVPLCFDDHIALC